MTAVAQGTSALVSLPSGQPLVVTGSGIADIGSGANYNISGAGATTIGPFNGTRNVTLYATITALDYNVGTGAATTSGASYAANALFSGPRAVHMFGDSLTDFCKVVLGASTDYDVRGFMSHAMAVSLGQVQPGTVLGLSGQGTTAINTAMAPVLPTLPAKSLVNYFSGANDSSDTAAALLAKLTAGISAIVAAGHTPIVCTILPSTLWAASQAKDDIRMAVNNGLRVLRDNYMAAGTLFILVEWDQLPFSGNGLTFIPGFFYDGATHPGVFGSEACGIAWWNAVKPYFSTLITRRTPFIGAGNRFSNPQNAGGTATTAPTGWSVGAPSSGSQVISKVRGTDGDTTPWLQVAVTPGASITYAGTQTAAALGAAAIGTFSIACEVEVDAPDAASLLECKLRYQNYGSGTQYIRRHLPNPNIASLADYYSAGTKKWFFRIPPVTADSDAANNAFIYLDVAMAANKPITYRMRLVCDAPMLA
jgi:hypothetical protein